MDNFTHSLVGWGLGQTGLKNKSRKGLAALILGANLPDIDVLFGWTPWAPLATHRGFTHGLVGGIVFMPALLAALLWLLDRWQLSRGGNFKSGLAMRVPWLVALSYLGALTHPFLDLQTSYAVQLLSPFSTTWFHTDTLFIIDAVIWTILPLSIWLSRRRERHGLTWRAPAIAGLSIVALYIGLNGGVTLAARQSLAARLGHMPPVLYAQEQPVLFWRRTLIWREKGQLGWADYDPIGNPGSVMIVRQAVRDGMTDPLVRRAMAAPSLAPFLRWSTMPFAQVKLDRCVARVKFSDARFVIPGANRSQRAGPFDQPPVQVRRATSECRK